MMLGFSRMEGLVTRMSHRSKWIKHVLHVVSVLPGTRKLPWPYQPINLLDEWSHRLKVPRWIQNPMCDALDEYVGLYDDDDSAFDDTIEQDCS
jgi:hypothetical protein